MKASARYRRQLDFGIGSFLGTGEPEISQAVAAKRVLAKDFVRAWRSEVWFLG
jgi:hypothetical protein